MILVSGANRKMGNPIQNQQFLIVQFNFHLSFFLPSSFFNYLPLFYFFKTLCQEKMYTSNFQKRLQPSRHPARKNIKKGPPKFGGHSTHFELIFELIKVRVEIKISPLKESSQLTSLEYLREAFLLLCESSP